MNASQRRQFRRSIARATGLDMGMKVCKGATCAVIERLSPTGGRNVLVKRRDNRRVLWPLADVAPVPA